MNILCAGIPRSGSTWLFNVIRVIFLSQSNDVFSDWEVFPANPHEINIIKVHGETDLTHFDFILTTRRDLRDIAASWVRIGWCENKTEEILQKCRGIVKMHELYFPLSNLEIPYEEMWKDKIGHIGKICSLLGQAVNQEAIHKEVLLLTIRAVGMNKKFDCETQIHRNHITNAKPNSYSETLSRETIAAIEREFSSWLEEFGYEKK